MSQLENAIKKRQKFYWLGRNLDDNGDTTGAIKAFETYATYLLKEDEYIPHQWISKLYDKLGEKEKSLSHMERFAGGCPPPRAAIVYKEIGERYLTLGNTEKAISNFESAYEITPKIGVKSKIEKLKSSKR